MKLTDLLDLCFPRYCLVCEKAIFESYERYLCIACYSNLPLNIFPIFGPSPLSRTFWGRCEIQYTGSFLIYQSDSMYSNVFKEIKYRERPDLGKFLGCVYGQRIQHLFPEEIKEIDWLLPVPMTRKKEQSRGYNQAKFIAEGLAKSWSKTMDTSHLLRVKERTSQTRKSKFERWINAQSIYTCAKLPEEIKHVAIIDDVVTTGSTIEGCVEAIRANNTVKISVFSLGFTHI